jgi:GTP-binding protein Era
MSDAKKKSGIVTIIGRPSVGKSTFLNTLSGEKISIVSPIPQTTRNAIRGIINTSLGQLVFIDTPGYHASERKINQSFKALSKEQRDSSDAIIYMLDASREPGEEEVLTSQLIAPYIEKTIIVINKIDLAKLDEKKNFLAENKAYIKKTFPHFDEKNIIEVSAQDDTNLNEVLKALYEIVPEGEALYPEEFYTDQEVDFRIAEIVREKAIEMFKQELPHAIFVSISDMEWKKPGKELWVRAFLNVEKESQKGMVIGKGATMIKTIRVESIKALRKIFSYRIDLDLQVRVNKNWRQKDHILKKIVY